MYRLSLTAMRLASCPWDEEEEEAGETHRSRGGTAAGVKAGNDSRVALEWHHQRPRQAREVRGLGS